MAGRFLIFGVRRLVAALGFFFSISAKTTTEILKAATSRRTPKRNRCRQRVTMKQMR
jgi:hypothetical protein